MRPVRPSEHHRRQQGSSSGRASPLLPRGSSHAKPLARPHPVPRLPHKTVRCVEIRGVAVVPPDEGFVAPDGGGAVDSLTLRRSPSIMRSPSPLTMASAGSPSNSPLVGGRHCKSPYGFIPIPRNGGDDDHHHHHQRHHHQHHHHHHHHRGGGGGGGGGVGPPNNRFTPPLSSPLDFRKSVCSPSMMSTISSDDTEDTASLTLDASWSRAGSPFGYHHSSSNSRAGTPLLGRSSPRPRTPTTTGGGRQSPFPKSNDSDDASSVVRKTRIKTEMCMHYVNNRPCPFGATCTYAHGEEELQMTKLLDLERAGLIELETYRTKPCLTWVMTGSCPFGSRCTSIHDPRVKGTSPSWLTHTETQGNTLASDINVESLHQKRLHEVHSGTPFGHRFSLQHDAWGDLYKLVCNLRYARGGWIDAAPHHHHAAKRHNHAHQQQYQPFPLDPIHKLQIALLMRGSSADWSYKFRPQHLIYDEMCMVLQHRAFRIDERGGGDGVSVVVEIPLPDHQSGRSRWNPPRGTRVVEVRELAFGPDSDASVRGVALWFHVDPTRVAECTAAQAKRYRWKRPIVAPKIAKDDTNRASASTALDRATSTGSSSPSAFDHLDSFEMVRPHDKAAFALATDILKHRLAVLRAEGIASMRERFERLQVLERDKTALQRRFEGLRRHWTLWGWPVNAGREKVDKNTPVPRVDGKYEFPRQPSGYSDVDDDVVDGRSGELVGDKVMQAETGVDARPIWSSFVSVNFDADLSGGATPPPNRLKRRLSVFQHLAEGHALSPDPSLPLLVDANEYRKLKSGSRATVCEKENCWRALLLEPEREGEVNEWSIVREHFENSRSNKVLSIIQSKSSTSGPPGL